MSSPVGTVRRSCYGVVAVCTDQMLGDSHRWLASAPVVRHNYWRSDEDVADWRIVYTPPTPESKIADIDIVLGKHQRGEWSAPTSLAAITRIHAGTLILNDEGI